MDVLHLGIGIAESRYHAVCLRILLGKKEEMLSLIAQRAAQTDSLEGRYPGH